MTVLQMVTRSCVFSDDRIYRYRLDIAWGEGGLGNVAWCLLNPSTADEIENDPTVERRFRWSMAHGYDSLSIVNIFAYRATDPDVMKAQADPVGPDDDRHILEVAKASDLFVVGWGNHGSHLGRGWQVTEMLSREGIEPQCLGINRDGQPKHPLYTSYTTPLRPYP
jgi:hypothetical protein